jgi:hypothetical protein
MSIGRVDYTYGMRLSQEYGAVVLGLPRVDVNPHSGRNSGKGAP